MDLLTFSSLPTGKPTQTGKAILKLQLNLPTARVLYSSATGASEPNNLAYMVRLGACGFGTMPELVKVLNGYAFSAFNGEVCDLYAWPEGACKEQRMCAEVGCACCRSGLGSLEVFSMGLKATGCYVSRCRLCLHDTNLLPE